MAHKINLDVATACCPFYVICCTWRAGLQAYGRVLPAFTTVNNQLKKTWKSHKILWTLMKDLKKVSEVVSVTTNAMAYLDASDIAKRNGAHPIFETQLQNNTVFQNVTPHAVLWPYQKTLPVEEGLFETDLCDHTWKGGQGYSNYLCYASALDVDIGGIRIDQTIKAAWALLLAILPPPLLTYEAMKEYHYDDLCSASGATTDVGDYLPDEIQTMQCDTCTKGNGKSEWSGERIELTRNVCNDEWEKKDTTGRPLGMVTHDLGARPPGKILDNGFDPDNDDAAGQNLSGDPCRVCNNLETVEPSPEQAGSTRYFADIWTLQKCTYDVEVDQDTINSERVDHDKDKVDPLVLADNWQDEVKYTSLVLKRENMVDGSYLPGSEGNPIRSLKSEMSGEMITYGQDGNSNKKMQNVKIPERTWAVARAEVYNPGEQDLFNQNWHAKLAPVDAKGIEADFMGLNVPLPERLKNLADDAVEEVWTH
jgi:hypothetical protein